MNVHTVLSHVNCPGVTFMHAVGDALYCDLECMLVQVANDLYLVFIVLFYEVHSVNSYWGCVQVFHIY